MRSRWARALGAIAFAAVASGCGEPPGDILLISVDTLRADHTGLYGYERDTTPAIDAWFEAGAIYTRAYATDASTTPSMLSMLSGKLPQDHGVRLFFQVLEDAIPLIPDRLPANYQSAAFVSNMVLTDEAVGIADRFDHFDDFVDQPESDRDVFERNAARTTDAVLGWLAEERDEDRPLFLWVHYVDPHGPYRPPADAPVSFAAQGERVIPSARIPAYIREPEVDNGLEYVARYDAEIAYLDQQLDRLLRGYAVERSLDSALLIFTADHGESLMDHELWFSHGYQVYDEIVRVPLALRGPGVAGGKRGGLVSLVDVYATVLLHAGVAPEGASAVDLRDGSGIAADRVVFSEARDYKFQWRAAIRGDEKWVLGVDRKGQPTDRRRFYDLGDDPQESSARTWGEDDADVTRRLLELQSADPDPGGVPVRYARGRRLAGPKVAPDLTPEVLDRLRALGYVDAPEGAEATAP